MDNAINMRDKLQQMNFHRYRLPIQLTHTQTDRHKDTSRLRHLDRFPNKPNGRFLLGKPAPNPPKNLLKTHPISPPKVDPISFLVPLMTKIFYYSMLSI